MRTCKILYNQKEAFLKREMKGKIVGTYETLNDVLVNLFRDITGIEQKAVRALGYPDITNNDMHVIEAIGVYAPRSHAYRCSLYRQGAVRDGRHSDHIREQPGKKGLRCPAAQRGGPESGTDFPLGKGQGSV